MSGMTGGRPMVANEAFFGILAHHANACGNISDLPIALPQLTDDIVAKTLQQFSIDRSKQGYLVLDNASSNY
jgi:hypothetical protein